jgi:hypothetical protein
MVPLPWRGLAILLLATAAAMVAWRPTAPPPEPVTAVFDPIDQAAVVVRAYLVARGSAADCGFGLWSTRMIFTDEYADSATRTVLVPCAELPRPQYSATAGDAPVLEIGTLYRLELSGGPDVWTAERIDIAR